MEVRDSFTLRPLYPQGKSSWYSLNRRVVGTIACLDMVVKGEIFSPSWDSNPQSSSP
jgi:hypothetical protein